MPLWQEIDQLYVGISDIRKAEELFAFTCELIDPDRRADYVAGAQSLQQVFMDRARPMQMSDLITVTAMVAEGLHDRSRSPQTFLKSDSDQFMLDTAAPSGSLDRVGILPRLAQPNGVGGFEYSQPHLEPSLADQLALQDHGEPFDIDTEPSLDQQLREQDAAEASRKLQRYEKYENEPSMDM